MNKLKKEEFPQKRALTVDEIISKYPMSVRILLVQLVEQVERLEKKKSKKPQVSKKWVEEWYEAILMNSGAITDEFGVRRQIYLMLKEAGVKVVDK